MSILTINKFAIKGYMSRAEWSIQVGTYSIYVLLLPLLLSPPFDLLSNFCTTKAVHINQALNQAEGQKATQPTI